MGVAGGWTTERAVPKDIVHLGKVRTRPREGEGWSQLPEPGLEPAQRPGQVGRVRGGEGQASGAQHLRGTPGGLSGGAGVGWVGAGLGEAGRAVGGEAVGLVE